jgi:hypothetical protein
MAMAMGVICGVPSRNMSSIDHLYGDAMGTHVTPVGESWVEMHISHIILTDVHFSTRLHTEIYPGKNTSLSFALLLLLANLIEQIYNEKKVVSNTCFLIAQNTL